MIGRSIDRRSGGIGYLEPLRGQAMRAARSSVVAIALLAGLVMAPGRAEAQAVGFFPNVGSANDGVSMSVVPVVTADRRYVRLSLNANFSVINGFNNFPVSGAVGGGGIGPGGGGLGGGGAGGLGGGGAGGGLGGAGGLGNAGGGFRNVFGGAGLADSGVPYNLEYLEASRKADAQVKPENGKPIRGKKPLADPVIVPMKKTKPNAPGAPRG
jgi:hypothetical protein